MRVLSLLALAVLTAAPLVAQAPKLSAAPSTRATTVLSLSPPRVQGQPAPTALTVKIDNLETIVLECTGSQEAADELIASHTIGEVIGFITASFQPPKAAE